MKNILKKIFFFFNQCVLCYDVNLLNVLGLVSLLNIINFRGLFNAKAILLEEQQ